MAGDDNQSESGHEQFGEGIDTATFEQILEMDDDDDREFSQAIVFDFFEQAAQTFEQMNEALEAENSKQLSELGHFLKGSSATIGLTKVKESCEKIQHWGALKDEYGERSLDEPTCLAKIKEILPRVVDDCKSAELKLKAFYSSHE